MYLRKNKPGSSEEEEKNSRLGEATQEKRSVTGCVISRSDGPLKKSTLKLQEMNTWAET